MREGGVSGNSARDAPPEGQEGLPVPRRYWAIAGLCLSTAAIVLDGAVVAVALPTITRDLGISPSSSVHVVTIYQLVAVVSLIPMAALGDRLGYRAVYRFGLSLLTVSVLLCFFVKGLIPLLMLRFAQAIGASLSLSVSSALLREVYPARILGRGLALNSMIVSVFTSVAPTLGGAILAYARWPMVFASAVPFALAALLLSRSMPDPVRRSGSFDFGAALLYGCTMAMLFGAMDGNVGFDPVARIALLAGAILLGLRLYRRESRRERPVIPVDLLRQPVLGLSALGSVLCFMASMAVIVMLPFRLEMLHGFTTPQIGLIMSIWPLTTLVVAPVVGLLSDRIPARLIGTVGMAVATLALCLLAEMDRGGAADFYWRLALCAFGFACFTASNARLILAHSPRDRAASAGSLISTARLTGQSMGAILAGTVLSAGAIASGGSFYLLAALTALTGLCSVSRGAKPGGQSAAQ